MHSFSRLTRALAYAKTLASTFDLAQQSVPHPNPLSRYKKLKQNHRLLQRKDGAGPLMTPELWQRLCDIAKNTCVYCGKKTPSLQMDHLTPVSKGGVHTLWNILPACESCNRKKHDKDVLCPVQPVMFL